MKAKRVKRTMLVLICLLCAAALALALLLLSYPLELNMATLPQYLSSWYSRGQSPELPHEVTLYDGVEVGNRAFYLLEIDEGGSGQQFGYVTLERGPLGRYRIIHMGCGGGSLYDGVVESGGKKYLLLGGRDPGERIFKVTAVLGGQTYELEIPKEQGHFLLCTEIDSVSEESHVDRGKITFYDRQGEDITALYNLDGGGIQ